MSLQSDLVEDYSRNTRLVHTHLDDLNHSESLVQPGGTGNSLNWILGHLLLCRIEMLELMEQPSAVSVESLARYDSGSQPVGPGSTDIWKFEDLLAAWYATDPIFIQTIQNTTDEAMQRSHSFGSYEMTLYRRLHFFFFHESFHIGQFEILRHLVGKSQKLI